MEELKARLDRLIVATEAMHEALLHGDIQKPGSTPFGGDNLTPKRFTKTEHPDPAYGVRGRTTIKEWFSELATTVSVGTLVFPSRNFPRQINRMEATAFSVQEGYLFVTDPGAAITVASVAPAPFPSTQLNWPDFNQTHWVWFAQIGTALLNANREWKSNEMVIPAGHNVFVINLLSESQTSFYMETTRLEE